MKTIITNKTIWNIAYPIILGSLAQTLITLTDTAFLGRVSEVALGASAMAGIYYYVFSTLAWGFSIGIQIIVARRLGEGKLNRIGVVFEHGLCFVFFLSMTLFLIQRYYSDVLLGASIQSPNIYAAAMEYMSYRHYGIIFVCFNFLFRALYIGLSNTKIIGYSTAAMATINVIFNYLLIFGKFGFPELGVGGAALASVMAEISACLIFIFYTLLKLPIKQYALFSFHKLEGWLMLTVLKTAFPTMLQKLLSFGTWYIFFMLIEHMGERPIAITIIVRSVYMLILIPVFGYGATANTLTSRLIGEQRQPEIMRTLRRIVKLSMLSVLPVLLICYTFPHYVLSIYSNSNELIAASIPSLYVVGLAALSFCFGITFFEAISGTGNTTHALILESFVLIFYTFQTWLFTTVVRSDVAFVWTVEITYGILIGVVSLLYLKYTKWQQKKV
ncbi:MATE family efflux transporter [Butyricimonas virosa]|uniref:Multidrug-efflux transporter n=1 Tax=Butyricimonas virosa TaxID=544645 RepID=A0A412X0H8_9BACT|nr:MATE family efflux transporter [Butyricimonas virosa]MBR5462924.1 MATE family efflux transporter [Butyricimonas sp.]RGV33880.1 MATE family efflux transporter [Butyricimonas virosa]